MKINGYKAGLTTTREEYLAQLNRIMAIDYEHPTEYLEGYDEQTKGRFKQCKKCGADYLPGEDEFCLICVQPTDL